MAVFMSMHAARLAEAAQTDDHFGLMDQVYRRQRHFYDLTRKYYLLGRDALIRVLDAATGALVKVLDTRAHAMFSIHVAWAPDGVRILSAGYDSTVRVWDLSPESCRVSERRLAGHTNKVSVVTWAPPGGDRLLMASGSNDGGCCLWNVATGECLRTLVGAKNIQVWSLSFSEDGSRIASGGGDGFVRAFEVSSGECLKAFEVHDGHVYSVAWSNDGTLLASGGSDKKIIICDVSSDAADADEGGALKTLRGHSAAPHGIAWAPSGALLASSDDSGIRIWDVATGGCVREVAMDFENSHFSVRQKLAWSPDGARLAALKRGALSVFDASR